MLGLLAWVAALPFRSDKPDQMIRDDVIEAALGKVEEFTVKVNDPERWAEVQAYRKARAERLAKGKR